MNVVLEITDLNRALEAAAANLDASVREGLAEAAELVEQSAKRQHGYQDRSGDLTKSIAAQEVGGAFFGGGLYADILADTPYAASIESGSKPHVIRAKRAKALRFTFGLGAGRPGIGIFARQVNHPGTKAYRFLGEALERELDEATARVFDGALNALRDAGFEIRR